MPRRPIRRFAPALAALLSLLSPAFAAERPVKIGVLNDMSGPYADYQGQGSVIAAQLAIEDFAAKAGRPSSWSRPTTRTRPISAPRSPGAGSTRTAST